MNFTDISCFLNKLKIKQKLLEKHNSDFMKNIVENYGIVLDDENIVAKAQNEHQISTVQKNVQQNQKILQELKTIVSPENIPKIDLLALKHKMLSLENSIQTIKDNISSNMEGLITEENDLFIDVTNLEMKYSDFNRIKNETNRVPVTVTSRKAENACLYQEVEDFGNYVNQHGGHEGGWSQNDHLIFLRYYHQTKTPKTLLKIMSRFLPDFSEEKISSHIEWYEEYIRLRENQKNALEEWRRNKGKKNNCHLDIDEKSSNTSQKKKTDIEAERQNIKDKILKWKLKKEQIQQEVSIKRLNVDTNLEKNIKRKEKIERDVKSEVKNDVYKWRASKKAQERADQIEKEVLTLKERERKIMVANALIRQFQKQDSLYIMRRINKHNIKTDNFRQEHCRRDSHNNQMKYRDPERLFKATRQWRSRISNEDRSETMFLNKPLNVQQIPKLGVPTWRLAAR